MKLFLCHSLVLSEYDWALSKRRLKRSNVCKVEQDWQHLNCTHHRPVCTKDFIVDFV